MNIIFPVLKIICLLCIVISLLDGWLALDESYSPPINQVLCIFQALLCAIIYLVFCIITGSWLP